MNAVVSQAAHHYLWAQPFPVEHGQAKDTLFIFTYTFAAKVTPSLSQEGVLFAHLPQDMTASLQSPHSTKAVGLG